ncbi:MULTISPECIES: tRNA 2-selenouridine(34) synthase MnmH [Prochlorococcus]|uniref:Predicted ATPase n=1 Tax=Prochlorococcus marinus (strain SARG / CCMP1375 / SS120) TaxID=167539 RepID=Q7VCG8_PROMA|nr:MULTISPECIES: tRNA 2-selenouridine(34) synthase MnmH [Prochlorococcus]AAP99816.1 Predicted ATPase [Prochlorococcus marinus subsp. marinus str. CCMP1375]KGG11838.1 Selenophosphate-dependent tRNA 2-selenouridine synthase [Prochlorococcus marinus str. LG]KGG21855.1 Selenophosphate-dependent tRNA 2-selenouridine synthase [Prochlorococcus marinus str. SS2]KGG23714.1 Selenophosphate-dependent tRNA 2-selenouridine synthase [Prochlorococcus marinus str. SS35]KGG32050.1 Selenophosphate-dependent tRN
MSGIGIPASYSLNKFRNTNGPLIDIRSPKEFNQGHLPGAKNIPLFNNEERALIGTTYKKKGKQKAINLGLEITTAKLKDLVEKLLQEKVTEENSFLRIYCWRGGLRSSSLGWLANILNLNPILLSGGYKNYRKWTLNQFEKEWPLRLLGGKTGTGKTSLLLELAKRGISIIDLEGIAMHKGSSFGGIGLPPQPSSEQFENFLAEALDNSKKFPSKGIWVEAESPNLGKCRIPNPIIRQMKKAPLLEVIRTKEERITRLVDEYSPHKNEDLKNATLRISKRLGPQRTKKALESIHKGNWREACLAMLDYYDKCYEYELEKVIRKSSIDLSGLSNKHSAEKLIQLGHVY